MIILFWIGIFFILIFSFVIAFGAPFLPTLSARTEEALDLLDLKPGQTMLELGSGDGRILRAAAERGIYAVGYELNPLLVIWTKLIHWKKRKYITVHWGNYWRHKLPPTDGIYVFLLNPYMTKLDKKIEQDMRSWYLDTETKGKKVNPVVDFRAVRQGRTEQPGHLAKLPTKAHYRVKVVSFAFEIPNKKPYKEKNGLFLYLYQP